MLFPHRKGPSGFCYLEKIYFKVTSKSPLLPRRLGRGLLWVPTASGTPQCLGPHLFLWPQEQGQSLINSPSTQARLMGKAVGGEAGPLVIPSRPQPCRPAGRRWACSGPQPGPRFSGSTAGPLGDEASGLVGPGWPRPPPQPCPELDVTSGHSLNIGLGPKGTH